MKASFEKNFHCSTTDRFLMVKYGCELEQKVGEALSDTWDRAEQETIKQFCKKHPDMAFEFQSQPLPQIQKVEPSYLQPITEIKKENADDVLKASLKEMMDAKDLDELKGFEIWAKANDAGKTYDELFKKLSK